MAVDERTPLLSEEGEITVAEPEIAHVAPANKSLWHETLGILASSGPVILGMAIPFPTADATEFSVYFLLGAR
jgi:hypothetical protein